MAIQAPFKLAQKEVPKRTVLCDQITNWVLLSLNVIPPVLFGLGIICAIEANSNGNLDLAG